MGAMDNRSILAKADLTLADLTSNGGLLQPAQAQRFMRQLIKQSKLMGLATVVPMRAPKQYVDKIRFAGRVLRAGYEARALSEADRAKPDIGRVELDAQLFKAEVRLDNEVLEDNIENGNLRQTVMDMLGEAIARDLEEVMILGDTTSLDPFLAKLDGLLKQATSNVYDALTTNLTTTHLRAMLKLLPQEYLRDKEAMRFITSINAEADLRDQISQRATVLGDQYITQSADVTYTGIPIVDVPMFPENLGGGTNTTDVLFTDPKNIQVGIWRNIRLETDKMVSEGVLLIVASLRFDVTYAEEAAVVKAVNVKVT